VNFVTGRLMVTGCLDSVCMVETRSWTLSEKSPECVRFFPACEE
jgi:hypothetical protein